MRRPQFTFFRGSSPTLELTLPLTLTEDDGAFVTLSQGMITVLEYRLHEEGRLVPGGTLTLWDAHTLLLQMTQADTLMLRPGECELQLRVCTREGADVLVPCMGYIGQTRKEGVI